MSLYGALYAAVSGLKAQSNKIGVISDNIANVNTIGYKGLNAQFESLVVSSQSARAYSPGGVTSNNRLTADKQGLLLTTDAPTDISVSGDGFFVVKARAEGTNSQPLYSRAGSFRKDELGNFVNAAGFYLQGWPLDRDGALPPTSASLESLQTVNVDTASGVASATTTVNIGANLNSKEVVYPGASGSVTMDKLSTANYKINAITIIAPDEYGLAPTNSITRGDQMTLTTGNGLKYSYQYGGFTIGRDIAVAGSNSTTGLDNNYGDGAASIYADKLLLAPAPGATSASTDGTTNTVIITMPNHGLIAGDKVTLSGFSSPFGGIPGAEINTTHLINYIDANTFSITTTTTSSSVANTAGTEKINTRQFAGNVLDATNEFTAFLATTGVGKFTTAARSLTIDTTKTGPLTFNYVTTSPSSSAREFNNLNSLATAIDNIEGLTARIQGGRLVVGAEDASESVSFSNGDAAGTTTLHGIDWVQELGLSNVAAGSRRYSTLQGLADIVKADEGVSATITNPLANAALSINVDDPLDTIQFDDYVQTPPTFLPNNPLTSAGGLPGAAVKVQVTDSNHGLQVGQRVTLGGLAAFGGFTAAELNATHYISKIIDANTYEVTIINAAGGAAGAGGANTGTRTLQNNGSLLSELGLTPSLNGAAYSPQTTGVLGPQYDPTGAVGKNMASGDVKPQFSRVFQVYDALGTSHDLRMSFIKIAGNKWATEIFAVPATDVSSALPDGQIATGNITFNGDGTLRSVDSGLSNGLTINWTNGAVSSNIKLDLGTAGQAVGTANATLIGDTNGLSQFAGDYNVAFVDQNGTPVGELIGVSIDADGIVSASFSNGDIQKLYKLPLADFANPNGLEQKSGNVFSASQHSGVVNLREAGTNGTGKVVSGALEASNVELSEQLTDLIVAQRAYQSNTRAISAADKLLEQLNQL